ncbi:MAG: hypothetical protein HFJ08_07550 [Lachnospiraceae bacterium]|jgi:hypothetical protein|nr:hypothetical protein [Lachnospiraceae bacterium]MCI9399928.1 hypothetical protein [Lachnospiraceae bacterium]MCX4374859.1 hypothetical protein [Lachnospiraceae bacterium]
MKHLLKGTVIVAALTAVNMIINIICNMNGVDLNALPTGAGMAMCGMFLYQAWTKNEAGKEV